MTEEVMANSDKNPSYDFRSGVVSPFRYCTSFIPLFNTYLMISWLSPNHNLVRVKSTKIITLDKESLHENVFTNHGYSALMVLS